MTDGLDEAAQTAAEHAAATAADPGRAAKARPSRPAALEPDTPDGVCANCETQLQGPVCHVCGQLADSYHRPVRGLLGELFEGLFALDGRVVRTIPNLLARPGRITRDYLKGRRARYMPPFRLYIIASLIFFLLVPGLDQLGEGASVGADVSDAVSQAGPRGQVVRDRLEAELQASVSAGEMTEDQAAQTMAALTGLGLPPRDRSAPEAGEDGAVDEGELKQPDASSADAVDAEAGASDVAEEEPTARGAAWIGPDAEQMRRFFAPEDFGEPAPNSVWPLSIRRHVGDRLAAVSEDPQGWLEATADWVPRIMFVMVPVYALLLSLVYAWRRRFFFYDHLIVSMHFHSALFLTMSAGLLIGTSWTVFALLVYSNIYLYRINRVVYARGRVSSVLRTLTLDFLYSIVLSFGFIAVLLLGAIAG